MATAPPRVAPPPPLIGKVGRYTVFITPPRAPKPSESPNPPIASPDVGISSSAAKVSPFPEKTAPSPLPTPPPVQVPPLQFDKTASKSSGSIFGFFWDAIAKVQDAHSSLDEYLADWFGLNQSKYQWALNDYYDSNGKENEGVKGGKLQEIDSKCQVV
ncbi:proline-rich receptor-like protein kinase PERK9 [Canna indica]|uniref:Proline-rich receptor-like protein kinase PERK9 n=1 Tax=Canna indica TaxID=4628 RepID=A0AAQ3JU10_9LILI|nr:proline-rich receptor-like protein kinase PERK9 [Canna indica]